MASLMKCALEAYGRLVYRGELDLSSRLPYDVRCKACASLDAEFRRNNIKIIYSQGIRMILVLVNLFGRSSPLWPTRAASPMPSLPSFSPSTASRCSVFNRVPASLIKASRRLLQNCRPFASSIVPRHSFSPRPRRLLTICICLPRLYFRNEKVLFDILLIFSGLMCAIVGLRPLQDHRRLSRPPLP